MLINWSVDYVKNEINKIAFAENDPRATGFETWRCKKDLYEILWHVEEKLKGCSTYSPEEEFLKERARKQTWKVLTDETKIRN